MSEKTYRIKWKNTWSGEEGFVKKITADHFEDTKEKSGARKFKSEKAANSSIAKLEEMGEGKRKCNIFEVV